MTAISPNVVILTRAELRERLDAEFQRGVARGKFEAQDRSRVARNCANWRDGVCEVCGVQWQDHQVGPDFKCPGWQQR